MLFPSLTDGCRAVGVGGAAAVEGASSPAGGPPAAIPSGGTPSSRFVTAPFFVDCILICWGLEFIGELLVVWSNCTVTKGEGKSNGKTARPIWQGSVVLFNSLWTADTDIHRQKNAFKATLSCPQEPLWDLKWR